MSYTKTVFALVLALFACIAHAEIYMDLRPNDTVVKVRAKYPNAQLVDLKPAWLKPHESFKSLTGSGISGTIYLKFSTTDASKREARDKLVQQIEANPQGDNAGSQAMIDFYTLLLNAPLDERLTLDWVRWVPLATFPIQRLESKYGKPEKCDYAADTFEPYCEWTSKGVFASLTDTKTMVMRIDFNFTENEWKAALGLPMSSVSSTPKPERKLEREITVPPNKTRKAM